MPSDRPNAAVVLGARNLGGAITRDLLDRDIRVATVARTQPDLAVLKEHGAITIPADAGEPDQLTRALARAEAAIGAPDLIVNAVSAAHPPGDGSGFGGGSVASASLAGFDGWTVAVAQQAFVFLGSGARALGERGGTLVQITGGPARRANPKRGLVAAGSAAVRALTHAAALELRETGVHVALLIVDGIIASPKTERMTAGMTADALVRQEDVSEAVHYLATQTARGMTHELVITPAGDRWLP
jgi:NAD(P)-dependent dehydrogenase (short-subunit alcohol dehydrogenase family)